MLQLLASSNSVGLLDQLAALCLALLGLLGTVLQAIFPWIPLFLWIAFWLFAVNWQKLRPILLPPQMGIIGVLLLAIMTVLVWATVSEPAGGFHHIFGLQLDNLYGKFVYVTGLWLIAILCARVQLSGACGRLCHFSEPVSTEAEDSHGHHDAGH